MQNDAAGAPITDPTALFAAAADAKPAVTAAVEALAEQLAGVRMTVGPLKRTSRIVEKVVSGV